MTTYTIGEISERSGFSPSALRYYEGIGLLVPTTRSASGYRIYDDSSLGRLAFISRAKRLGCSLQEITDLLATWDTEKCGPLQRSFHSLVTDKIRETGRQMNELAAFSTQLRDAAAQLGGPPVDGPCADDCACLTDVPPVACSLGSSEIPDRLADWQNVLNRARTRSATADGALRWEFDSTGVVDQLARLTVAEQKCCPFFSFTITVDARGIALDVRAPAEAAGTVRSLFGQPA
ncbi:MAG TPA: MerR family transcriptional regulator [Acidimicrobiales bacterium]|nr:MerR family transcriptional regulator [Acidimicrobiales bacterium]